MGETGYLGKGFDMWVYLIEREHVSSFLFFWVNATVCPSAALWHFCFPFRFLVQKNCQYPRSIGIWYDNNTSGSKCGSDWEQ